MASRSVRVVVSDLDAFTTKFIKRLALNINAELIKRTPVDTGWARANWVPNIGSPFEGTAGTREDAEAGRLNTGVQQTGLAEIVTAYRTGPTIHQTNNVPYIEKLNSGSSKQAPAGYVQASILAAVRQTVTNTR